MKGPIRLHCKLLLNILLLLAIGYLCANLVLKKVNPTIYFGNSNTYQTNNIDKKTRFSVNDVSAKNNTHTQEDDDEEDDQNYYNYDEEDELDEAELKKDEREGGGEEEEGDEGGRESGNHKASNQSVAHNEDRPALIDKLKSYATIFVPVYANEGKVPKVYDIHVGENLDSKIIPSARNVTPEGARLVIYNRVPKCGSTTVHTIIQTLHQKNKFHHRHSVIWNRHWLTEENRKLLATKLFQDSRKNLQCFDRHIYYFNTTRLGFPKAAWINLVREPVARMVSQFYFTRSRSRWRTVKHLKRRRPKPPNWWFDLQLDDCIEARRPECFPHAEQEMSLQLTFFCGHHPECRKVGSRWALHRAKRHVESYYSVVGLLEELPLSLSVLEGYLPAYFKDVRKIPLSSGAVKLNTGEKRQERTITNSTKEVIRGFLKEDIEFYDFVRQRLHLQAKKLGLIQ